MGCVVSPISDQYRRADARTRKIDPWNFERQYSVPVRRPQKLTPRTEPRPVVRRTETYSIRPNVHSRTESIESRTSYLSLSPNTSVTSMSSIEGQHPSIYKITNSTIAVSPESVLIESPTVSNSPEQLEDSQTFSPDDVPPSPPVISRAYSDSAVYKNKVHEKLRQPAFLNRQKAQKSTQPLFALPENPGSTITADEEYYQRATLEKPELKVQFLESEAETSENVVETTSFSKSAELTYAPKDIFEPIKALDRHVSPTDNDYQKIVCGLPCEDAQREKELNYTLAVLTGARNSKPKPEEKRSLFGGKRGLTKRKIL